jgi:Undecaprenyl-phosphate glucose phosphotransferase
MINTVAVVLHLLLTYINSNQQLTLLLAINISWFITAFLLKSYWICNLMTFGTIANNMLIASFVNMTMVTFIYCYVAGSDAFPRVIFSIYIVLTFIFLTVIRYCYSKYLRRLKRQGYLYKNALIVGMGDTATRLKNDLLSEHSFGITFIGFIVPNKESHTIEETVGEESRIIGCVKDIPDLIDKGKVDKVYWTLPTTKESQIKEVINLCEKHMVRFYLVPNILMLPFRNFGVESYASLPVLHYRKEPLEELFHRVVKRSFDIVFSFFVITLILSWLMPFLWLFMKFTMPGPFLFKQDRSGKGNKTFKLLKIRSMNVNEQSDRVQAVKGDQRITKLGVFLRKSSLDEMPQFINVFLGQMTVIGPRPHMLEHTEFYSKQINNFMVRHLVKPGITGWAQVNGYRGGTETLAQMEGRLSLDMWYLENWSFWLDVKIIFKTMINAFKGDENAY